MSPFHNTQPPSCPSYFSHWLRRDWSCKYSLSFASWSMHTREWLKSIIVRPKSATSMLSKRRSPWSMSARWISAKVARTASLSQTCQKTLVRTIQNSNEPIWNRQDKVRRCSDWSTYIWHDKCTCPTLHIVKQTQRCRDSGRNPFWPQLMINLVLVPQGFAPSAT